MAAAEVGALRVVLGMDVAQFAEGAKNADQVLNRLATRMGITAGVAAAAGTLIGNALTAAAASIVDGIKGAINSAEEMADAAEKFGLSIETVSAIVKSGEVPIASLNAALEKLSQNLVLVGSGEATSPAARALKAIGVAAVDAEGNLRPVADVIGDIADKFETYREGPAKAALATTLFGNASKELIGVLSEGSDGIEEMKDKAVELGLALDANTGLAARELKDSITALGLSFDAFYVSIANKISPIVRDFSDVLTRWADNAMQNARPAAEAVANGINAIYMAALNTAAGIERLGVRLSGFYRSAMALFTSDEVKQIQDEADAAVKKIDEQLAERKRKIEEFQKLPQAEARDPGKRDAPLPDTVQKLTEAQRELNKQIQDGVNLAKQSRDSYQVYIDSIKALDAAQQAGKISAEQYGQAQRQAVLVAVNAYAGAASNIAGSLTQVFQKSKGVAIAAAIINSFQAATNALAQAPWPLNYVAAAAALAAGFVQVSNIRKTTEGGGGGEGLRQCHPPRRPRRPPSSRASSSTCTATASAGSRFAA